MNGKFHYYKSDVQSVMFPHRDLLPIIFAYLGLKKRQIVSAISRDCFQNCISYHYFVKLDKDDAIKIFKFFCGEQNYHKYTAGVKTTLNHVREMTNRMEITIIQACLNNPSLVYKFCQIDSGWKFPIREIFDAYEMAIYDGRYEIVKILLAHPRMKEYICWECENVVKLAQNNGHTDIYQMLMANQSVAEQMAKLKKQREEYEAKTRDFWEKLNRPS